MALLNSNYDLIRSGYLPFVPDDIIKHARMRLPGYLPYIESVAKKEPDGYWYIHEKDLKFISQKYKIKSKEDVYAAIFDDSLPCNFKGCDSLRNAYKQEITSHGDDCKNCEKQRIKNKYIKLAKTIKHE